MKIRYFQAKCSLFEREEGGLIQAMDGATSSHLEGKPLVCFTSVRSEEMSESETEKDRNHERFNTIYHPASSR